MYFKKQRAVQDRLDRNHRRIETFHVPRLQNSRVLFRSVEQRIGFRETHGHGFLDENVESHFHQPAANFGVGNGRNRDARGVRAAAQFLEPLQSLCLKFCCDCRGAFRVLVEDADKLRALEFAVHPRVVAPEFARTNNGDTNPFRLLCRRVHSLFIPLGAWLGSDTAAGGNAWIAIPAPSASSISFARSKSSVRPASTARAVAPAPLICSMVGNPTTGTSKRISCSGLLTLITTRGFPSVMRAARAMVLSVPSIASTATQARSAITTVCPMSMLAMRLATPSPYAMSSASCSFGARRVSTPGSGTKGFRNRVESTRRIPSSSRTRATAPISASVFFRGSENSSFASFQSGRMALKILLCFTCPAMTACFTPSWCIKSMVLLNSPRLTQCSRLAIFSSSTEASSFSAITAISIPWLRAPSSTRKGNRPFPAMSPQPVVLVLGSSMKSAAKRYFTMPRSALSINLINSRTSAESPSDSRISARACEVFSFARNSKR